MFITTLNINKLTSNKMENLNYSFLKISNYLFILSNILKNNFKQVSFTSANAQIGSFGITISNNILLCLLRISCNIWPHLDLH